MSSPQGKFSDSAALLDGRALTATDAHGKHLFLGFGATGWVHIHLGLFGKLGFGAAPPPPPTDTVRLRLVNTEHYADLRGPTTCALITEPEKRAIHERLGPDPLRGDEDGERAWQRVSRSRTSIAALLMDQKVIAGVGNVYRAEVPSATASTRTARAATTRADCDASRTDLEEFMASGRTPGRQRPRLALSRRPGSTGAPDAKDDPGAERVSRSGPAPA
ncbi:Fpg/Nei family DNA glycosylase [Streptomyces californicus]